MAIQNVTWDTVNKGTGVTLSNGNLTSVIPNSSNTVRASRGKTTGKWYCEIKFDALSNAMIGIVNASASLIANNFSSSNVKYYYSVDGNKYAGALAYGSAYAVGDIISILLDLDVGTIEFWKNGVTQGVAFADVKTLGEVFPAVSSGSGTLGSTVTANFGKTAFTYLIPTGYIAYASYPVNKILISSSSDNEIKSIVPKVNAVLSGTNAIPIMTSNTAPSGIASASSIYSTSNDAWNAFDNNGTTSWSPPSGTTTGWLAYEFSTAKKIGKYSIKSNASGVTSRPPKNWTFEGSNDGGVIWTVLDMQTNQTGWVADTNRNYTFYNNTPYKKYRINISANNGDANLLQISELLMFEITNQEVSPYVRKLTTQTEQDFINLGIDDLSSVDPTSDYAKKQYIQSTNTTLGSGKTFTQPIDLIRYKVNKITFQ